MKMDVTQFRQRFGHSRIFDEQSGRPMMLYHGSHEPLQRVMTAAEVMAKFDEFTRGLPAGVVDGERKIKQTYAGSLWFTDSEYVAGGYAEQVKGTPTVTPVYLSICNPLDLTEMSVEEVSQILSAARGRPDEVRTDYGRNKGIAHAVVRDAGSLIQYAKAHGYDGLIYPDTCVAGRGTHTSYVTFEPEQVIFANQVDIAALQSYSDAELRDDKLSLGVVQALREAGWMRHAVTAVATKRFDCLDISKDAFASLTPGDGLHRALQFEFISEGRNVAEACGVLIPAHATEGEAWELAGQAVKRVERAIAGSYGVRLADRAPGIDDLDEDGQDEERHCRP